ncbi:hypothetical protein H4R21_004548, partial [Coemansia helicoidea]
DGGQDSVDYGNAGDDSQDAGDADDSGNDNDDSGDDDAGNDDYDDAGDDDAGNDDAGNYDGGNDDYDGGYGGYGAMPMPAQIVQNAGAVVAQTLNGGAPVATIGVCPDYTITITEQAYATMIATIMPTNLAMP